jgi:hypothetical protein
VRICGEEKRGGKVYSGVKNASESAIADYTMMTPGETGGCVEVYRF